VGRYISAAAHSFYFQENSVAEKTLEQRVADLERLLPVQMRALSRLNDQETASIKADIGTLRAQMLAGHASLETRLDGMDMRLDTLTRDVAEIKQTLDALPRVLAEELARKR
jgi:uncharacterized coiled-coil protein SlyX